MVPWPGSMAKVPRALTITYVSVDSNPESQSNVELCLILVPNFGELQVYSLEKISKTVYHPIQGQIFKANRIGSLGHSRLLTGLS